MRSSIISRKSLPDDPLRLGDDPFKMLRPSEALGVELVDLLGTGRPSGKPTGFRDDFDPANRITVARGDGEDCLDAVARQLSRLDVLGSEAFENQFLRRRGRRVDPLVTWITELTGELLVGFTRITTSARSDLGREESGNNAVLVRRPDRPVAAQERGSGALFTGEAEAAREQSVDKPFETDRYFV